MTDKCKCGYFIDNECNTCGGSKSYFCPRCIEDYYETCICPERLYQGKLIDDLDYEELRQLYDFIGNGIRPFNKTEILFPNLILNVKKNKREKPSYSRIALNIRAYCINKIVAIDLAKEKNKEALKYISIASKCYSRLTPETRTINYEFKKEEL